MYYYPPYRITNWTELLILLQRSLHAESMVCSLTSQLFHIPETKNVKGLQEADKHLYESSYHRVTAVGAAYRLANGETHDSIVKTLSACIENAQKADISVDKALQTMLDHSNGSVKPFIETILKWQNEAKAYLEQARKSMPS